MARKISNFLASDWLFGILHTPIYSLNLYRTQTKDDFDLEINKKCKSSIGFNIHNSKVFRYTFGLLSLSLLKYLKTNLHDNKILRVMGNKKTFHIC